MLISSLLLPNPFPTVTSVINNLAKGIGQAQQHLTSKDHLPPRQASASYSVLCRVEEWDGKILPDAPHFSPDHKNNLTEKKKLDDRTLPKSGHQVRILEGVCAAGEQAWVAFLPRPLTPTPQQHKVTHVERVREISGQFREKGS